MASERSIGSELEHHRLERRAMRVRRVLQVLHRRIELRNGSTPRPLRAAIEDFGRELAELERRLGRARRGPNVSSRQQ
jgi:uncharacterized membrane protein YccC